MTWSQVGAATLATVAVCATVIFVPPVGTDLSRAEAVRIHAAQTRALWLSDQIGDWLYRNSDLMQRFSHYTDSHPEDRQRLLCPECGRGETRIGGDPVFVLASEPAIEMPPAELSQTARELTRNLESHFGAVQIQNGTLTHTLDRLRDE